MTNISSPSNQNHLDHNRNHDDHQESARLLWWCLAQVFLVFQPRPMNFNLVVEQRRPGTIMLMTRLMTMLMIMLMIMMTIMLMMMIVMIIITTI